MWTDNNASARSQHTLMARLSFPSHAGKTLLRGLKQRSAALRFLNWVRSGNEKLLSYEFSVVLLSGATDADVLDIFSRINSYAVTLNAEELRNARYLGAFKKSVYKLGHEHLEFWRSNRL